MQIGNTFPLLIREKQDTPSSAQVGQFIRECTLFLQHPLPPERIQRLLERIFHSLGERRFDDHLEALLPVIETLVKKNADFTQEVPEINHGIPCLDFTCPQVAFIYWKQLAKENHPAHRLAEALFKLIEHDMNDIYTCVSVGYFLKAISLLNSRNDINAQDIMQASFLSLAFGIHEEDLRFFVDFIKMLLKRRANPNFQFSHIYIKRKGSYKNASYLHITYLYWQFLKNKRSSSKNTCLAAKEMKELFLFLLKDPRIDVRLKFTEESLDDRDGGHFSGNAYEGDYLEEANLAHYALAEGDFSTCQKILSLAPDLIGATCFTTKGKWWLERAKKHDAFIDSTSNTRHLSIPTDSRMSDEIFSQLNDVSIVGPLVRIHWEIRPSPWRKGVCIVERRGGVSPCHIAARQLDLIACTFLVSVGGNEGIPDSARKSVIDYAHLYAEDDLGVHSETTIKMAKAVFKVLRKVRPLPPTLPQAFYILHQEGYDVMYHPGTKCPVVYEVLYEDSLGRHVDSSKHKGYRQHPLVPKLNRAALSDFKAPGVICGHAKPRADALSSDQALYDVGYLTNILAQDPILNNGLWKKMETIVRNLIHSHICLHVYTGGVFTSTQDVKGAKVVNYRVIGQGEVSMPTHLFKVIYYFDYDKGWQSFAWLVPNLPLPYAEDPQRYIVPTQRIQELTGIDFAGKYTRSN